MKRRYGLDNFQVFYVVATFIIGVATAVLGGMYRSGVFLGLGVYIAASSLLLQQVLSNDSRGDASDRG